MGLVGLLLMIQNAPKGYAQEAGYLNGIVKSSDSLVSEVYIKNLSRGIITTTNDEGAFKIRAEAGDTLIFSHIALKESVLFLKPDEINHQPLIYKMNPQGIALDEVRINQYADIDAVALGIIDKKVEPLTQNERKLNAAGDFKWIHLLSLLGGSLEVDPILNKINGRTKRLKRYIKMDQKMENIHFLESRYSNYMIKDLEIPETAIGGFLYHLADQESLQALIDEKREDQLQFFIVDQWVQYKKLLHQEDE